MAKNRNIHSSEWKKRNPEKVKEYSRIYYFEHQEERIAYARNYQSKHIDEIRAKRKLRTENNKERLKIENRIYRQSHKEELKNYNMLRYHGISLEEIKLITIAQNNKCAICGCGLDSGKRTHLDHNHKTNKIRGLLCGSCNAGIGLLKDDKEIMLNAYKYLNYWEGECAKRG